MIDVPSRGLSLESARYLGRGLYRELWKLIPYPFKDLVFYVHTDQKSRVARTRISVTWTVDVPMDEPPALEELDASNVTRIGSVRHERVA